MIKSYITIPRPDYPPTVALTENEINELLLRRGLLLRQNADNNRELFKIKYLLRDLRRNRDRMRKLEEFKESS